MNSLSQICDGKAVKLKDFANEVSKLEWDSRPDYDLLKKILRTRILGLQNTWLVEYPGSEDESCFDDLDSHLQPSNPLDTDMNINSTLVKPLGIAGRRHAKQNYPQNSNSSMSQFPTTATTMSSNQDQ